MPQSVLKPEVSSPGAEAPRPGAPPTPKTKVPSPGLVDTVVDREEIFKLQQQAITRPAAEPKPHITKVALDYLRLLDNPPVKFRFDIVEVLMGNDARKPDEVRLVQNAFDVSEPYIY